MHQGLHNSAYGGDGASKPHPLHTLFQTILPLLGIWSGCSFCTFTGLFDDISNRAGVSESLSEAIPYQGALILLFLPIELPSAVSFRNEGIFFVTKNRVNFEGILVH